MDTLSRRNLLFVLGTGLAASSLLSGCVMNKTLTSTTVVINVAKIQAFCEAGLNAANTVASVLELIPAAAKFSTPIHNATSMLITASAEFSKQADGSLTVEYDKANWKTLVDSLLASLRNILGVIADALTAMVEAGYSTKADTVSKVQIAHDALATIVSLFEALLFQQAAYNVRAEQSALRALNV